MKEDKWVRLWNMISPPALYMFIQMGVELAVALITIIYENVKMYKTYGMINDAQAVTEKVQQMMEVNASYITVASAVMAVIFFGRMYLKERNSFLKENNKEINTFVMIAFGVMLSMAAGSILSAMNIDNIYGSYEKTSSLLLNGNIVYRLFALGVITPAAEEIIFRGLVFNRVKKQYGSLYGIVVSSVMFGVFHFNLVQGLYAFIIGMAFAYCYELTGDLKVPVYMHMSINVLTVLSDYYGLNSITDGNTVFKVVLTLMECIISVYLFEMIVKKSWKRGK
ncbi:lysostaphin resistance A-like protein [Lachnospiraceae bacterium HCP1S3_C3]|nr:CPBP family intramembrane metalloprotease [Lachnospiraceae bacterium]MDD6858571.1 CPBP family intramembrane metalloprotease [Lachnospiraceae bacterium]